MYVISMCIRVCVIRVWLGMFNRLRGWGSSLRLVCGNDCNRERRGLMAAAWGQ